jgi:hypothetical protein
MFCYLLQLRRILIARIKRLPSNKLAVNIDRFCTIETGYGRLVMKPQDKTVRKVLTF